MSDDKGPKTKAQASGTAAEPTQPGKRSSSLTDLMATGEASRARSAAPPRSTADLEAEALLAAEEAVQIGEQTLVDAGEEIADDQRKAGASRRRELMLRALLTINVLAMVVVASLPSPRGDTASTPPITVPLPAPSPSPSPSPSPAPPVAPPLAPPSPEVMRAKFNEPWNQALAAAERGEFAAAVQILERYLEDAPRMAPSQKLSVLSTLSHYAARNNDFKKAQEYERRADAIDQSHSLPEDLVAMAKAAAENGDQETLRRVWARFLLQQRQVPTWLYKHVAEAYLQLGDSYRQQANAAAEQARLEQAEQTAARLRAEREAKERK